MNRISEKTKAKEITIHTIPRLAQYLRSLGGDYTQDASAGKVRFFSQLIYHHDYIAINRFCVLVQMSTERRELKDSPLYPDWPLIEIL